MHVHHCMPGAGRGQERALPALKLELQTVVKTPCVCACVLGLELRSSARAALLVTAESSLQSDFIRGWLGAVLLGVVLHSQGLRTFHGSETIPLLSALIWKVTGVTRRRHCDDRAGTELLGMHSACVFFFSRICVCVWRWRAPCKSQFSPTS